ncbi:MAG: hypothetical protein HUJ25_15375 [Crocinitomicaceae bacterium]|nr:hypothetical protein [Crocinitomicaceae bacterium]
MIKKYLPHIFLAAGIIMIFIMMYGINQNERLGRSIMERDLILKAIAAAILSTAGIAMFLKRM